LLLVLVCVLSVGLAGRLEQLGCLVFNLTFLVGFEMGESGAQLAGGLVYLRRVVVGQGVFQAVGGVAGVGYGYRVDGKAYPVCHDPSRPGQRRPGEGIGGDRAGQYGGEDGGHGGDSRVPPGRATLRTAGFDGLPERVEAGRGRFDRLGRKRSAEPFEEFVVGH